MTDLILKPFRKTSVSKLNTAEMCLRYYHYQHVLGIVSEIPPARLRVIEKGKQIDQDVENWIKGTLKSVSGAAAVAVDRCPLPNQPNLVKTQKWVRFQYAGVFLIGCLDFLTLPGAKWGRLARIPKNMVRVSDLKSVKDVRWVKTREQLDTNRQLLVYVLGVAREDDPVIDDLVEISHVGVERDAPHRIRQPVRIVSVQHAEAFEEEDRPLVQRVVACHGEENTLELPAPPESQCDRFYGSICPYYDRCHAKTTVPLEDLWAAADQDGRGGRGTRDMIDRVAAVRGEPKRKISVFEGDYGFLSNFYQSILEFDLGDGLCSWQTSEHCFQAAKTLDQTERDFVHSAPTPSDAKWRGRRVTLCTNWEQVKEDIMYGILRAKFRDKGLADKLLATGDMELEEGNTWRDGFWGIDLRTGRGLNKLGKLLMTVRNDLRHGRLPAKGEDDMINASDANPNTTTELLEGAVVWKADTLKGKPYCSVAGERHGKVFDLRLLGNDYRFLIGCQWKEVKRKDGTVVKKTTSEGFRADAVVEGASQYEVKGQPAYRLAEPGVVRDDKIDADLVRKLVLNPLLRAWDDRENPATEDGKPNTADDALSSIEKTAADAGGTELRNPAEEQQKLISAGCSESQAEKMVAAGVTDGRLRAGDVSVQELASLPRFSEPRAEKILQKYGVAPKVPASDERVAQLEADLLAKDEQIEALRTALESYDGQPAIVDKALKRIKELESGDATPFTENTLYVDCVPLNSSYVLLENVLAPYLDKIAADRNVPDVQCLKAFEWPGFLMEALHANPPPAGPIVVRGFSKEWDVTRRFFIERSTHVIFGTK